MRILLFNLATDLDDPILGFASGWIRALAARMEFIHVITMRAGRVVVPSNVQVHSVGKERGYSEPRRVFEFYRHLYQVLRDKDKRIDACFSHMMPIFSILAAPVLKVRRIPLVTWYAHRQVTAILKLAHHLSDRMVSINGESYPYRSDKLVSLGHGIDTEQYAWNGTDAKGPPLLLSVGRISPIKDPITLVEAVGLLRERGCEIRCVLVGDAPERDHHYAELVRKKVESLRLENSVQFAGAVSNSETVRWYRRCFAHVNCSPPDHSLDKSPLEAMACGKPSFSSTLAFKETMGEWADLLIFRHRHPEDLARRIEQLLRLNGLERRRIGDDLSRSVVKRHDLQRLSDRLIEMLEQLCR